MSTPFNHMNPGLPAITRLFLLLGLTAVGSVFSQTPAPTPTPAPLSPDQQWRYVPGDKPTLANTADAQGTLEFSACGGLGGDDSALPVWAPDSKRFAIPCPGGKGNSTLVYQLRNGTWETGEELGNGDEIMEKAGDMIEAQAKKKGMPAKTFLHMNSWTVEPQKWADASTLLVYAAMTEVAHRNDGSYAGAGFGTDLLLTLKFDDAGAWKIVGTHRMSAKEAKQAQSKAH